ncbi:DMT family transporter [Fusibacter sp. JL216-2]|uniref:DMT family transporter n=1 Tax=Fusibacter sp. JL216-2 TaxID=3071453 RepID=UPI003D357CF3
MKKLRSTVTILAAAILWGTTGTAQAFSPENSNALSVGAFRMIIGGIILLLVAMVLEKKHWHDNLRRIGQSSKLRTCLFCGGFAIAMYQPLFFTGVKETGVAFGTVLAIGSAPIFTAVLEILRGRRPSVIWAVSTLMALIGCYLLYSGRGGVEVNVKGAMFALGVGFSYSIYVQSSKAIFEGITRLTANAIIFASGGLLLLPIVLNVDIGWIFTVNGFAVAMHLGIVTLALAYSLFAVGLKHVPTSTAVTLTLAEPLTATILGVLLFKEVLPPLSIIGICILFIGLFMSAVPSRVGKGNPKSQAQESVI